MPPELWFAFVATSIVMLAIPGPTVLTVVSYSMTQGTAARIPLVTAVALGDATALTLSLIGLGALLSTSAMWFTVIKWLGGLYLLYLGFNLFRAGISSERLATPKIPDSRWKLFFNTWLVTALNPKGIVFFVAFLPQFIDSSAAVVPQLWILSITFVALATLSASLYALFAARASRLLTSPRSQRRFNMAGGALLSTAGIWALTANRPA
ncbi:lysine transporter LysE [Chromatiales bacterium (ex Bugula neritina AB1)]|nr:lysine transporter LysE [Chromatiales bacterium (ex Bugula neritina AB1)]